MSEQSEKYIHELIEKASKAVYSRDAIGYTQAASNAASALCALKAYKSNS